MAFAGQHFAIMGLGRSGVATALRLQSDNAHVYAWDDNAPQRHTAQEQNIPLHDLSTPEFWQPHTPDYLVLAPGIPHALPAPNPVATLAQKHGVPIISDVSLLPAYQPHATYIGITGTNGKSTTTALLEHCLKQTGVDATAGGNLGIPVLQAPPAQTYVLEISSYMAERLNGMAFNVGLLMNLTPDHLDRHGDMQGYLNAKMHMFNQCQTAIVVVDDEYCQQAHDRLTQQGIKTIALSAHRKITGGIYLDGDTIIDDTDQTQTPVLNRTDYKNLLGIHNAQNMMAVYACMRTQNIAPDLIAKALHSFTALPHRQQWVANVDGVDFVNDSKGTNLNAVTNALSSYNAIHWIAGGQAKQGGYDALIPHLPRMAHSYLIGESQHQIAEFLTAHNAPHTLCDTLENAVATAYQNARANITPTPTVLLSPACASWDQFNSFEHRGDVFMDCVKRLNNGEHP